MKKFEITDKTSVRVNGVSIAVKNMVDKPKAQFVAELKHEFDGDEAKTGETFDEFHKAVNELKNQKEEIATTPGPAAAGLKTGDNKTVATTPVKPNA
mgnify:CR=1 FL=1